MVVTGEEMRHANASCPLEMQWLPELTQSCPSVHCPGASLPAHSGALPPSWPLAPLALTSLTPLSEVSTAYPCPHQHIHRGCRAQVRAFLTLRLDYVTII